MSDEQPFTDAIAANPTDWDLRSVYADWLEEQGRTVEANYQRKIVWMHENIRLSVNGHYDRSEIRQAIFNIKHHCGGLGRLTIDLTIYDLLLAGF